MPGALLTQMRMTQNISKSVGRAIIHTNEYTPVHNNNYRERNAAVVSAINLNIVREQISAIRRDFGPLVAAATPATSTGTSATTATRTVDQQHDLGIDGTDSMVTVGEVDGTDGHGGGGGGFSIKSKVEER
jgi:hypothetical protein